MLRAVLGKEARMAKRYVVALEPGERRELERRLRAGRAPARVLGRGRGLL